MTSYNGQTISYDALGNPRTYRDGMTMQWERGRNLSSLGNDANGRTYIFTYNSDGMRVRKEVVYGHDVEKTVKYYWNGNQIAAIQDGTNLLHFTHDQDGNLFSVTLGSDTYYYLYNIQGDVIGLIDSTANQVVSYRYDTWGKPVSMTDTSGTGIGTLNPFRYRGYCYDEETGFYYVSSRYYDPEVGRWLNADSEISGVGGDIIGYNLYSYCGNNPVNRIDPDGHAWKDVKNWFSNTWNKVKKTAKKIVTTAKKKAYSVYYKATKWHFEDRATKNGAHPSYSTSK
ncbi:MAG: RHS repeat-associated core domain-containing protein [Lachnoclostridium sp.]